MSFAGGAAVVATVAALAATLDAHHSISAIYDSRRQVTVTDTAVGNPGVLDWPLM